MIPDQRSLPAHGSLLTTRIRPARADEVDTLQAVERDAAQAFISVPGHAFCTALPVRTAAEHAWVQETGNALALEVDSQVAGFVLVLPVDGRAHILELAVDLAHQRRGYGRLLLAAAEAAAAGKDFTEMTLTTYRDVPWNAPFYRRLGFAVFPPDENHPELSSIIADEAAAGVAQAPRVAMRKVLGCRAPG